MEEEKQPLVLNIRKEGRSLFAVTTKGKIITPSKEAAIEGLQILSANIAEYLESDQ